MQPQPSLYLASFVISIFAGTIFGIMPLRQIFKADPNDAIKGGSGQSAAGRRWALRDVLLAAQIALCCVTVTAAFVALRGLHKSLTANVGFKPQNAVVTKFDLALAGYSKDSAEHFQRQLLDRAGQLRGVEAVSYSNTTPLAMDNSTEVFFSRDVTDLRRTNEAFVAPFYCVAPGYFNAAGTPLLEGRDVSFTDAAKAPAVAVVNQEFARQMFHTEHGVGQYFKNQLGDLVEVVGIVADGKYLFVNEQLQPAAFLPILQRPDTSTTLVIRSHADAFTVAAATRQLVRDLDPAVPFDLSSAWSSQLALQVLPAQAATVALGIFGAFGLLLSITGTFGLASYSSQQTPARTQHPRRAWRPSQANSFHRTRTHACPARERRPRRHRAGIGCQPSALLCCVRRLRARPICARRCHSDDDAHRRHVGRRTRAARVAHRSGETAAANNNS